MKQQTIKIAFRLDDPSSISDIEIEKNILALLKKHNMKCTFGIIPFVTKGDQHNTTESDNFPLSQEKTQLFNQAIDDGVLDIALHGFEHKTNSINRIGFSEFKGLSINEQFHKIKLGKEYLERLFSIKVKTFIPPWNSYDKNTISALQKIGINSLSADRYGISDKYTHLNFIPATIELSDPVNDVKLALEQARKTSDLEPAIIILMHHYDFMASGSKKSKYDYKALDEMLNLLKKEDDVKIYSISELADMCDQFSVKRYISNQPSMLENLYPPHLAKTENIYQYLSTEAARQRKRKNILQTMILYIVILTIGSVSGFMFELFVFEKYPMFNWILYYALGIFLLLIIGRSISRKKVYYRSSILITFITGHYLQWL